MGSIKALYDRINQVDIDTILNESFEVTEDQFADKNAAQMFTGVRSDGSEILPTYSDLTIEIKKSKGQPTDRVTLRDTGSFYRGIKTTLKGDVISIDSTDEKSEKLQKKYGDKILGLGGEFKGDYVEEDLRPAFMKRINEATGL